MKRIAAFLAVATMVGMMASTLTVNAADKEPEKMLRHIVMFKFADTAAKEDVQKIVDAFVALEGKIDVIADFEWGTNVSKEKLDKGLTHAFTLTFKSEADLDTYINHADHKAFVGMLGDTIADVCVFDYWAN
tara:strand:+ start:62 stop:457 length:396 start_codon:yes stop_codon:yes gene_type:complete